MDVREPDEYEMGHIPGAVLLPLGQVTAKAAQLLPDPQAVAGLLPHGPAQCQAVRLLEQMGYEHLVRSGGILRWPYEIEGDFNGVF